MNELVVTLDVTLLLGILIFIRLKRPMHARGKVDERVTVLIVTVFGILIAPTEFGRWVVNTLEAMVGSVNGMHL